mgnify:CR=1 FL=1
MKNYTITVNGNVYDVTVEEGVAGAATSAPKAAAPKAAAPKAAPKAAGQGSVKAMKMENEVVAPEDGTVASIDVAAGDSVEAGVVLATLN